MNRCSNKKEAVTEDLGAEHSRQRTASAKASLALDELMGTKGASVVARSEHSGEWWKRKQERSTRTKS